MSLSSLRATSDLALWPHDSSVLSPWSGSFNAIGYSLSNPLEGLFNGWSRFSLEEFFVFDLLVIKILIPIFEWFTWFGFLIPEIFLEVDLLTECKGIYGIFSLFMFLITFCLLYTSPSPRDGLLSRMPSSA